MVDSRDNNEEEEEDRGIEELLDAVDERTKIQTLLHDALTKGFMWIARERYRDALATYRKLLFVILQFYLCFV